VADFFKTLSDTVQDGDDQKVGQMVEKALQDRISATDILEKGLVAGLQALGERFKEGEVYLPEILISIRAMNRGVDLLRPYLEGQETQKQGCVVLGTIEGDLHDIGKNLVKLMLEGNGFRVVDLGIDVPAPSFAKAADEHRADIVGISSLLTLSMTSISKVIDALRSSGLRDRVRVMIGGAPITRQFADSIGAEGFAEDCVSAVDEAKRLMKSAK
jgi:5-methyltetrahydrofolate--homocysteine methyltransferase